MSWASAIVAGVVAVIAAAFSTLKDFFSGELKQKNDQLSADNQSLIKADEAVRNVDTMSRSYKLQFLERRGRLRHTEGDH